MLGGELRDGVGAKVVLLGAVAYHAEAGDIHHGEDARPGAVDHRSAKQLEVPPAAGPGVDHRRDAGAEAERVGLHAVIAGPGAGVAGGEEDVDVQIDEARRDQKPGGVDGFPCPRRVNGWFDSGHKPAAYRDIESAVAIVSRIDHATASQ